MLNENPDLPVDSPAAPARRAKPRGPARPETDGPFFAVEVADVPAEVAIGDERIVFHGVNKTGSGMMAEVLFKGFAHDGALDRYFSFYQGRPATSAALRETLRHSPAGRKLLFVDHDLYGSGATKSIDVAYVSQFRNPLPRAVSCYFWLKKRHVEAHRPEPFPSLEDWVVASAGKRGQFAQFAVGSTARSEARIRRMSAEQLFELGMKKVERDLRWFGIAEHFEESIFVMAHLCGLSAVPPWKRDLRNKGRTLVDDLPAATVDLIREVYRYDFMFYDHLLGIFRQRIAAMRFGPSLDDYKLACIGEYKDRILR